jgi:endonuclease YncB( thermonuclease family)
MTPALKSSVLIGLAVLASGAAGAAEYHGRVIEIRDGDTFAIRGSRGDVWIRLCGIDSPERRQEGYAQASAAISQMIRGKDVRCVQVGAGTPCDGRSRPTNRDRIVAQCFLNNEDIAAAMVRNGHACDWRAFSGGRYGRLGPECQRPR